MNKGSLYSHLGSWENRGVGRIQWNISNSFENLPYLLFKLKKTTKNLPTLAFVQSFCHFGVVDVDDQHGFQGWSAFDAHFIFVDNPIDDRENPENYDDEENLESEN